MSEDRARAISQRVANEGRARGLSHEDAFTATAMDRVLYRLGRSRHARGFLLKGGVLVSSLLDAPYRLTRDIDLLRRRGPAGGRKDSGQFLTAAACRRSRDAP